MKKQKKSENKTKKFIKQKNLEFLKMTEMI